eukprot:2572039-Rhodomonas_salina.1
MSGMNIGMAPIAYAEYSYKLIITMIDKTIVIVRQEDLKNSQRSSLETFRFVVGNLTSVLYESFQTDFNDLILERGKRMCSGISLMMGYTNVWA